MMWLDIEPVFGINGSDFKIHRKLLVLLLGHGAIYCRIFLLSPLSIPDVARYAINKAASFLNSQLLSNISKRVLLFVLITLSASKGPTGEMEEFVSKSANNPIVSAPETCGGCVKVWMEFVEVIANQAQSFPEIRTKV